MPCRAGAPAGWWDRKTLVTHVESLAICMLYGLPGFIQEAALTALASRRRPKPGSANFAPDAATCCSRASPGYPELRCCVPDAGMFMLIDVRAHRTLGLRFHGELYGSEGVSVIDGGAFGKGTRDFVRVCFAAERRQLRKRCERIRRFVAAR